jgi:hypothetical protein
VESGKTVSNIPDSTPYEVEQDEREKPNRYS